jgi:hypothetical protein
MVMLGHLHIVYHQYHHHLHLVLSLNQHSTDQFHLDQYKIV